MSKPSTQLKLKDFHINNAYLTKFSAKSAQDKTQTYSFTDPRTSTTSFGVLHSVPMGFIIPVGLAEKISETITKAFTGQDVAGKFHPYTVPGTSEFKYGFLTKILKLSHKDASGPSTDSAMFQTALKDITVAGQNAYDFYIKTVTEYLKEIFIIDPTIPITGGSLEINPEKFTLMTPSTGQTIQVGSLFKAGNNKELQRISDMVEKAKIAGVLDIAVSWGDKNNSIYTNYTLTSATIQQENAYNGQAEELNKRLGMIAVERRNASKLLSIDTDAYDFDFETSPSPVKEESDSLFE